jgi:chemotaxis protein CheC
LNKDNYTLLQIDTIKELANVGGGNAATSISQLIGKPVSMEVPIIEILNYNNVFKEIMSEDTLIDAIMMKMLGDAEGIYLFVTRPEASKALIQMMLPDLIKEENEELNHSTLKELVNIVVSSYLNAISKMVNVNLISSVPSLSEDMFGAILSSAYIESEQYDENIMIIKNEFLYQGKRIESSLYFIPKPGVLKKLFKILGV